MEKDLKCYACGALCESFVITYGALGSGVGLCRTCVKKGIGVSVAADEPLKECKPITKEEYEAAIEKFSSSVGMLLEADSMRNTQNGYWGAALSLERIFKYQYDKNYSESEVKRAWGMI